jgi:acetyl esterase/lipase
MILIPAYEKCQYQNEGMVYRILWQNKEGLGSGFTRKFYQVCESNIPPFMIAYADEEEPSKKQAMLLAKKLSEASVKNKVFHYEKKNTSSINKELGKETDKPTEDVYRFLQEIHYTAANPIK